MIREIEVKLLNIDVDLLKEKIIQAGGKYLGKETQINYTINSSSSPIDKDKGYLRIRIVNPKTNGERCEFTFKAAKSNKLVRDNLEYTINFDNPEKLLQILHYIGFDEVDKGKKLRESYEYKGARFDFDTWDIDTYPYPYVEIEGKNSDQIYKLCKELEIPESSISTLSIAELKNQHFKKFKEI